MLGKRGKNRHPHCNAKDAYRKLYKPHGIKEIGYASLGRNEASMLLTIMFIWPTDSARVAGTKRENIFSARGA